MAAVGSTRRFDIRDVLPLPNVLSPVELDAPLPGVTFLANPEGVEVTVATVATPLLASPPVPSVLPLEVQLLGRRTSCGSV